MNYLNTNLTNLHQQLLNKDTSSQNLVNDSIKLINNRKPALNAFITLNEDSDKEGQAIDQQGIDKKSILSGIPVAIKDNIATKDLPTTAASKMLDNFNAGYNATVIKKLKDSGAIVIGKTNMDEFAMGSSTETSYFGNTFNPWDESKVPGGSSGGSAAAVAAGEVPVALGSDTGGSIRQPAAFNGVVGLKPTYGRVSRWGLLAFASSFDQIGPITNNVKDNALVLNVISGGDVHDSTSSNKAPEDFTKNIGKDIKSLKVGVPKEFLSKGVNPGVKKVIKDAIEKYKSLGVKVEETSLPHMPYGVAAYYIIASAEASSNLERYDGIRYGHRPTNSKNLEDLYIKSRSEGFGKEVKQRVMLGTFALSAKEYNSYFEKAAKVRTLIINDFKKAFEKYDVLLGPTTPSVAFGIGEKKSDPITMYMNDMLTIPVNMAGLPAISIPAGLSNNMPVGMQLIGKPFDEKTLYQLADAFERNSNFSHKRIERKEK